MAEDTVVENVEEQKDATESALREKLQKEYDTRLEEAIKTTSAQLREENDKVVREHLERYRQEMAPPKPEDMQKLLDQEYVEFKVSLRVPTNDDTSTTKWKERTFTLYELPQKLERQVLKKLKSTLVPFSADLAALTMNLLEGDAAKKIVQLMNAFEPILEMMADIAAICLNPYGEDADITGDWVRENISSTRIAKIVSAQLEANHTRDFLSLLSRGSKLLEV